MHMDPGLALDPTCEPCTTQVKRNRSSRQPSNRHDLRFESRLTRQQRAHEQAQRERRAHQHCAEFERRQDNLEVE